MLESCSNQLPVKPLHLDLWQTLNCLAANSACCDGAYRTPAHVLALLPTSPGKTKPATEMIALLSNPPFRREVQR